MSSLSLPDELRHGIDELLQRVPSRALAARAAEISHAYRGGCGSDTSIRDATDVAAYLATRLPATYAAVTAALDATSERAPNFTPQSLLDFGAGPGTASWAAAQVWPDLREVTMLDRNAALLAAAKRLAEGSSTPALRSAQTATSLDGIASFDLVIAAYVFAELPQAELAKTAEQLWKACRGILVIVEPGTPDGFQRVRTVRETLPSQHAQIAAPCPGSYACPMLAPDWCHFSVRLPRSRAHMRAKGADVPFEDEKFSYVAFAREHIALQPITARILARPHAMKPEIRFKLCTAEGISDRSIARSDPAYKAASKKEWGDPL